MKLKFCLTSFGVLTLVVLSGLVSGCTVYVQPQPLAPEYAPPPVVQPPAPVYAPPQPLYVPTPAPPPEEAVVEIHAVSDFYEPLQAYGRWLDVPGYGHCWLPEGVDPTWRPYTDGHWQRTDAGWYWVSDEQWGWATCHYGRWHRDDNYGWVWVPQTLWAPAWVAWREGGGYTGWAPLPPEAKIGADRAIYNQNENIDPHLFVFVEEKKMLEPQRHQSVIVNNTTIINNTINITKVTVVNKIVINAGPRPESVAQATGQPIKVVEAKHLRTQLEATAVAAKRNKAGAAKRPVAPELTPPTHNQPYNAGTQAPGARPESETISTEARSTAPQNQPHQAENPPSQIQDMHPVTKANAVNLTPQKKLELEKKKTGEKKRLEKEKPHSGSSTNSPMLPHS